MAGPLGFRGGGYGPGPGTGPGPIIAPSPITSPPTGPIGGGGGAPGVDLGEAAKAAGDLIKAAAGAVADAGQNLWNVLNGIFRPQPAPGDGWLRPSGAWWHGPNAVYNVAVPETVVGYNANCTEQPPFSATYYQNGIRGFRGVGTFSTDFNTTCGGARIVGLSFQAESGNFDVIQGNDSKGFKRLTINSVTATCVSGCGQGQVYPEPLADPLPLPFRTLPEIEPVAPDRMPQVAPQRPLPGIEPAPVPEVEPLPEPAAPPTPPGPAAPPIAPPIAPPGTTPSPGTPTRTSPGTSPGPGPGTSPAPLPGTAPAPGTAPGTAPFPPGIPGTAPNPIPGSPPIAVAPPPPVTTPPGVEVTPDGVIGQPGTAPAPDLTAIAAEVGRIEQKTRQLLNRPQPNLDLGSLTDLLQLLLNLLQQVYGPGSYELNPVCEEVDPAVVAWGGGIGAFGQVNVKLDALAVLLQAHKDFRQPVCATKASGQPVTVVFEEI